MTKIVLAYTENIGFILWAGSSCAFGFPCLRYRKVTFMPYVTI